MLENRNPRYDLFAIVLLVVIVFLAACLLSYDPADPVAPISPWLGQFYQSDIIVWPQNEHPNNACGRWGAVVAEVLLTTLGIGAFFLVIGLGAVAVALLQRQTIQSLWFKTIGWLLTLIGLTTLANMLTPDWTIGPIIGPGGYLGALGCGLLNLHFARVGGIILATSVTGIGLFMWTEYIFIRLFALASIGLLSVFAFLLPDKVRLRLQRRLKTLTQSRKDDKRSKKRKSAMRPDDLGDLESEFDSDYDDQDAEYEDDDEDESWLPRKEEPGEDEDEWEPSAEKDDEDEEAGEPATIPFVVKTAANATAPAKQRSQSDGDDDEMSEPVDASGSAATNHSPFKFGLRKRKPKQRPAKPPSERERVINQLNRASQIEDPEDYELPELSLLKQGRSICRNELRSQTVRTGRMLERKFQEFGHKVRVVDVETGPVITQYELQLEAGLRLSKITSLADDVAIGLRVPSVRIVAPIPGKNTVGIEVPNETRQVVRLRDVMEQATEKTRKMKIPLFLGQDVAGETLVSDLSKLPHLLIAGRTGTGKSVCLNAIISSILMTRRPDEVRMLMIDPKMVELSGYGRLPHLMHPVVTDMRKAEAILAWAVEKMEDRYKLLARAGVRHINGYNQLGKEELMDRLQPADDEIESIPVNLPFIVIVADEIADLMMTAGKEVEQHIIRLAQKSRAVGIHLVLATQKPTVDVITGLIKSNLPARISFQVASQNDSRVVLDANGAEKLLGNGDMLFLWPGTSTLIRGQGTFLSDEEIDAITDSVSTGEQNFVNELVNMKVPDDDDNDDLAGKLKNRDELYNKAVEIVIRENRGSVSLLQRVLGIGYGRSARLIDYMEEDGIVGPYAGSKSREIIMTLDQWHQLQSSESESTGSGDDRPSRSSGADGETAGPVLAGIGLRREKADDQQDEELKVIDEDFDEQDGADEYDPESYEDEDQFDDGEYEEDENEDGEYEEDEYEEDEYEEDEYEEEDAEAALDDDDEGASADLADWDVEEDEEYDEDAFEESDEEGDDEDEDDEEDEYEYIYVDEDESLDDDDDEWEYEYVDEDDET